MNHETPIATLPAKLSALPERWIDRIFGRMEGLYGSLFIDRWRNTSIDGTKAVWAEELARFSDDPECFGRALKALVEECHLPPTLPEFVRICRKHYRAPAAGLALPAPSPTDRDTAAKRAAELGTTFRRYPADGLGWAEMLRKRYLSGERLIPIQISMASEALGEVWSMGGIEITERRMAA